MTLSDISCTEIDNYIHSLMMETHFPYTKYLTKCDNIILFHILTYSSRHTIIVANMYPKVFNCLNSVIVSYCHNVNLLLALCNGSDVMPSPLVFACVYCNLFLSIYETISLIYIYNPYYFCLLYN